MFFITTRLLRWRTYAGWPPRCWLRIWRATRQSLTCTVLGLLLWNWPLGKPPLQDCLSQRCACLCACVLHACMCAFVHCVHMVCVLGLLLSLHVYILVPPLVNQIFLLKLRGHPPLLLKRQSEESTFSKAFSEVVDKCVAYNSAERPSIEQLIQNSFLKVSERGEHCVTCWRMGL